MEILDLKKISEQEVIDKTCRILQAGGLVIFPTETTYGAGVDATNPAAVEKLLDYKSRREGKPLSIAVVDKNMASEYVEINGQANKLYDKFLPGPITVVSKSLNKVAPGVNSEFGTLGVRIPDYQLILDVLKNFKKPVTATSANASGKKRPYIIQDILDNLSQKQKKLISLILDAGELPHNEPSTVIDTTLSAPLTLRAGGDDDFSVQTLQCNVSTLISSSPAETQVIAGKLLLKNWEKLSPKGGSPSGRKTKYLIIGLNGPLGSGKTIFAKGAAKFLQIEEEITSPTYTYINEYDFDRHKVKGKFYHLDLWKIDSQESFDLLQMPELLKTQIPTLLIIEWWNQIADFAKKQGINPDLIIDFSEKDNERTLSIAE